MRIRTGYFAVAIVVIMAIVCIVMQGWNPSKRGEAMAAVGPSGLVQAQMVGMKGVQQTLWTALIASTTITNATAIDMSNYFLGTFQAVVAGTGTWTVTMYGSDDGTTYQTPNYYTGSAWAAVPTLSFSSSGSYIMGSSAQITTRYIKFVPTLSGSSNATFSFTPVQ